MKKIICLVLILVASASIASASVIELEHGWTFSSSVGTGFRAVSDTALVFPAIALPQKPNHMIQYHLGSSAYMEIPFGAGGSLGIANTHASLDIGPEGQMYVIDYGSRLLKVFDQGGHFIIEKRLEPMEAWSETTIGGGWQIAVAENVFWIWDHKDIFEFDKASLEFTRKIENIIDSGGSMKIRAGGGDELVVWTFPFLYRVVEGKTAVALNLRDHGLRSAQVGLAVHPDGTIFIVESGSIRGRTGNMFVVQAGLTVDVQAYVLADLPDDLALMELDVTDKYLYVFEPSFGPRTVQTLYRYERPNPYNAAEPAANAFGTPKIAGDLPPGNPRLEILDFTMSIVGDYQGLEFTFDLDEAAGSVTVGDADCAPDQNLTKFRCHIPASGMLYGKNNASLMITDFTGNTSSGNLEWHWIGNIEVTGQEPVIESPAPNHAFDAESSGSWGLVRCPAVQGEVAPWTTTQFKLSLIGNVFTYRSRIIFDHNAGEGMVRIMDSLDMVDTFGLYGTGLLFDTYTFYGNSGLDQRESGAWVWLVFGATIYLEASVSGEIGELNRLFPHDKGVIHQYHYHSDGSCARYVIPTGVGESVFHADQILMGRPNEDPF